MINLDINKVDKATDYMEKMAEGADPISGSKENRVGPFYYDLKESMSYVLFILREIKNCGYKVGVERKTREFPLECLDRYIYQEDMQITKFMETLRRLANDDSVKRINPVTVTRWLKLGGYLEDVWDDSLGKNVASPSEKGREIGLRYKTKKAPSGEHYRAIIYTRKSQRFLIDNMERILNGEISE